MDMGNTDVAPFLLPPICTPGYDHLALGRAIGDGRSSCPQEASREGVAPRFSQIQWVWGSETSRRWTQWFLMLQRVWIKLVCNAEDGKHTFLSCKCFVFMNQVFPDSPWLSETFRFALVHLYWVLCKVCILFTDVSIYRIYYGCNTDVLWMYMV